MSRPQPREVKKISGELFALTYGSLVAQLIKDYESDEEVNKQLEKMGFNIGQRLIDDFLAHNNAERCQSFQETIDVVAKQGFKMFLGISPVVTSWSPDMKECSLILDENPLTSFVELPESHSNIYYSNIICGVIRGALQMVQTKVEAKFQRDVLRGDESTEIRVRLVEILQDVAPQDDDD